MIDFSLDPALVELRDRAGTTDDPYFPQLESGVPTLDRRALRLTERTP